LISKLLNLGSCLLSPWFVSPRTKSPLCPTNQIKLLKPCKNTSSNTSVINRSSAVVRVPTNQIPAVPHEPNQTLKTLQKHVIKYKRNQPFLSRGSCPKIPALVRVPTNQIPAVPTNQIKLLKLCKNTSSNTSVINCSSAVVRVHTNQIHAVSHKPNQTLKTLQKHVIKYKRNQPFLSRGSCPHEPNPRRFPQTKSNS